jgi:hypothetical protein
MCTRGFVELLIRPARPVRSFELPRPPALQITRDRIAIAAARTYRLVVGTPAAPVAQAEPPVPLDPAGLAWLEGRLRKARALYERALRQHADHWAARFQLAWLDAAFGRLEPTTLAALERDELTATGRDRLRALAAADQRPPVAGDELAWDIEVLRGAGAAEDAAWWLERGGQAWQAGLFGVAAACGTEAAARSARLRGEAPAWMRDAAAHAREHLRRIASALP